MSKVKSCTTDAATSSSPLIHCLLSMHRHPPGGARGFGRQPFYVPPNRPGSVTGSIEGRMAAGRMMGARGRGSAAAGPRTNSSMDGSRMGSRPGSSMQPPQHSQLAAVRASHGFRTSSPLREVDETNCSVGDADDLWDAASLDYPGRCGIALEHEMRCTNLSLSSPAGLYPGN